MFNDYHPTLWRTCRVLASRQRLACLAEVLLNPDSTVDAIAASTGLSPDKASLGLRALQARGLVSVRRNSRWVHYLPRPDPLVPCAAPLLAAMERALPNFPDNCTELIATLTAFTHARRLSILRALSAKRAPQTVERLAVDTHISLPALWRHLNKLADRGLVHATDDGWCLETRPAPLAKTLLALTACEAP